MVTDRVSFPPGPMHVSVKVALALSAADVSEPLVGLGPDQAPVPEQDVLLVLDQVRVNASPQLTLVGSADSAIVGAGVWLLIALPLDPVLPPLLLPLSPPPPPPQPASDTARTVTTRGLGERRGGAIQDFSSCCP